MGVNVRLLRYHSIIDVTSRLPLEEQVLNHRTIAPTLGPLCLASDCLLAGATARPVC